MYTKYKNIYSIFVKIFLILFIIKVVNCEDVKVENNVIEDTKTEEDIKNPPRDPVKVSIIIPTYNTGEYLDRSIQSALNQTLAEIEVIVINDDSTDNTEDILKKYESDKRFRSIALTPNEGVSVARNIGMELAYGEFIGFIDSDDYVSENFYENLYKLASNNDIVVGTFVISTNDTKKFFHHTTYDRYGSVGDSIWRRSFLIEHNIKFDTSLKIEEDVAFRNSAYDNGARKTFAPDEGSYYFYKVRVGSLINHDEKFIKEYTQLANNSKVPFSFDPYLKPTIIGTAGIVVVGVVASLFVVVYKQSINNDDNSDENDDLLYSDDEISITNGERNVYESDDDEDVYLSEDNMLVI